MFKIYTRFFFFSEQNGSKAIPFEEAAHEEYHITHPPFRLGHVSDHYTTYHQSPESHLCLSLCVVKL